MSELKVHESEKKRGRPSAPKLVDQDRFRKLVDNESERGISRQKIADSIGCDVSTITKHYNGDSPIDLKYLYEYSKYFKVSTDYLLGLSEVSSPDPKDITGGKSYGILTGEGQVAFSVHADVLTDKRTFFHGVTADAPGVPLRTGARDLRGRRRIP